MKTDTKAIATILSALGVSLPTDLLAILDVEGFLDELDRVLKLAAGERQRLGELLCVAEQISPQQLGEALAEQQVSHCKLGEILIKNGLLSERQIAIVLEFQRRQERALRAPGQFSLGMILVADGQITRPQLEDALRRQGESGRRLGEELISAGYASQRQIGEGLFLQRKLIAYVLAVSLGLAPLVAIVPSAEAGQMSTSLPVSVRVIANAKMQNVHQARQLNISAADVSRGYVEAAAAAQFSVVTNSRSGFLVEFHPIGNLLTSVQVAGLGNKVQLGEDGGTIVRRGQSSAVQTFELSFRFTLQAGTQPGIYPWPLQMSVRAL